MKALFVHLPTFLLLHYFSAAAVLAVQVFVELGVLTAEEVEEVLVTEFNPVRIAIGDTEIITEDVLNCGVHPKRLLEIVKHRFLASGG